MPHTTFASPPDPDEAKRIYLAVALIMLLMGGIQLLGIYGLL
jgi:hypothetical protein